MAGFLLSACKPSPNPEDLKKREATLVSEIDGVRLYRVYDRLAYSNYVWFSTSGTQVDQCHQAGRTRHCESTNTPNSEIAK